eukprot:CAMPEP_0119185592 /NCGR_PEP_ID=MMETSP1315-20130426/68596_1 /TAXON_ID=676789 /ORGANISM="Prasinoderma singularis, Strain RCC927" /LENGTH=105 /DNA_ID=CAMNT_0007180025 /DNA_START=1602 /DNA_END=1916 /DNA_ORIENTATION=-
MTREPRHLRLGSRLMVRHAEGDNSWAQKRVVRVEGRRVQVETLGDGASETEWVTKRSSRLRALGDAKQWTHVARGEWRYTPDQPVEGKTRMEAPDAAPRRGSGSG